MNTILSFVNPLEFLLRYTVLAGIGIAVVGVAIFMMAKRTTQAVRKQDEISKSDRVYVTLCLLSLAFILIGLICIALPIEATFYVA